jgi:hypothetical protein
MSTALQPAARKSKAQHPSTLKVINDAIIVQLEEQDPAKHQAAITSVLVTIMTKEFMKYRPRELQAAKKGLPAPVHERYINVMLPSSPQQPAKVICYRLHISDAGIIFLPEKAFAGAEICTPPESAQLANAPNGPDSGPQEVHTVNEPSGNYEHTSTPVIPITRAKQVTVTEKPGFIPKGRNYPWLRFGGKYLSDFGFQMGKKVSIHLQPNKIFLTVDDPEPQANQTALTTHGLQ